MNWKTDKYLCSKFDEFDRKYFSGRLSKHETRVGWRKPFRKGHAGEFIPVEDGSFCLIILNPKMREYRAQKYALSTLLHEMCHMNLWTKGKKCSTHGRLFQNEMKRLAKIGAFNDIW